MADTSNPVMAIMRMATEALNRDYTWLHISDGDWARYSAEIDRPLDAVLNVLDKDTGFYEKTKISPVEAALAIARWQRAWAERGRRK